MKIDANTEGAPRVGHRASQNAEVLSNAGNTFAGDSDSATPLKDGGPGTRGSGCGCFGWKVCQKRGGLEKYVF